MHTDTQGHEEQQPKKRKRFFGWIGRAVLIVFLFFAFVLGLIHTPPVQQWGIKKITNSIGKKLDTRVSLDGFTLNPISDLTLKNIYIGSPDSPGDTLLYAHRLSVDYHRIWDLLKKRFIINQFSIKNGTLNIHRLPEASMTNLDLALIRLMPPRDTTKAAFVLDLRTINASELHVKIDDEYTGTLMALYFRRADMELDTLDITNSYVDIKDLDLDGASISIINRAATKDSLEVTTTPSKAWWLDVDHIKISDGQFITNNMLSPVISYPDPIGIDYAHMHITDLDVVMDSLVIRGWDFKGKNIDIHATHANGFEIRKLAAITAAVSKDGITAEDFKIITPRSAINNSISLSYSGYTDFKSFTDSVEIRIPQADMIVYIHDLLALAPGLQKVDFFSGNGDKNITLQGNIRGTINALDIAGINASAGSLRMVGEFNSTGLAKPGEQSINLNLRNSTMSAASLRDLFPKMKLPGELDRAGQVNFAGDFEGSPTDFHAFGTFTTGLGRITLDMNLNTLEGVSKGIYSGILGLQDFDLGTLIDNKDLGRVTLSGRVIDGKGLSTSSMIADITGELAALQYKGYTYRNARIDGQFTGKLFNGTMDINDPNVDMHFEGIADFRNALTRLDFIAKVDSLHLWELGFSKKQISLKGYFEVDLTGSQLNAMEGQVLAEHIDLRVMEDRYTLDTISLLAQVDTLTQDRLYFIESDVISGLIKGAFNPATLPDQLQQYLFERYPSTVDQPDRSVTLGDQQRLAWDLNVHHSQNWFDLTGLKGLVIENTKTTGSLDLNQKYTQGTLDLPELHYQGYNVYGSSFTFQESDGRTEVDLEVIAADIKENFFFEEVLISGIATEDSIKLRFKTDDLADIIDKIDMEVLLDPDNGTWNIELNPIRLRMLDSEWMIPAGNKLEFRKNYFSLDSFELVSGDQRIKINDIDNKGIEAYIDGFDISYLNSLWINDKFEFAGKYTLDLEIDNLFDVRHLQSKLSIPAMTVNNVPYGNWLLNASMKNPQDSVRIDLAMENNETRLVGEGAYLPPIKAIAKDKQNYLRLALATTDFPLDFLEFLLGGNIRDTEGSIDMNLTLEGKTNKLNPRGQGRVFNGSTTIDYLGAAYSFHDQAFRITETMIDLSGTKLYDVLGNTAEVEGGITHRYFRDLGMNATITSDRIMGLDVTSEENNVFYGRGIGSVFARFSGTLANLNMQINTTTARGTHIYIPLSGAADASDRDFVVFLENGMLPANKLTQINLGGINLTMNMTITEDAIIEIIFDENTGEVLRGIGNGDIQMSMTRTGEFAMYGNYNIEEGDYLFTNFRVIRKPFEILRGGSIRWDGDPYDANLNVQAKYKGLVAPVYTLIQEYLINATTDVIEQARERTDVDLTMTLTGSLLSPDISFDIAFPTLTGEVKGYVDSKVNALRSNANAMNEQVLGLLVTRSFLPSTAASTGVLSKGIDNTLSELFSATLSSYLGGLLGNLIPQGEFLSGIDFQVGLDLPITSGGIVDDNGDPEDQTATEVEINLPLEFFKDRLSVNVGGNYVTGASLADQSEYFAGDVTFEYQITADRRLKIRASNRNTLTVEGRKNKVSVGIAYRREYDTFAEIFGKKKKKDIQE